MKFIGLALRFCLAVFVFLGLAGLPGQSWAVSYTLTPFSVGDAMTIYPYGISNNGTVVGSADFAAFIKGASLTALGSEKSWAMSEAYGISPNGGQVVGFYFGSGFNSFGYQGLSATNDVALSASWSVPGPGSGARGVNDHGTIVGYGDMSGTSKSFKIEGGVVSPLAFSYNNKDWSDIMAYGINNSGVIVGQGTYDGITQAFRSTGSSTAVPLIMAGTSAGIGTAGATGINKDGLVVGWGVDSDGFSTRSFVCSAAGVCEEITSDGWSLLQVYGVNDSQQIVGVGMFQGNQLAFTGMAPASAVPVPAPLLLLSSGLAVVAGLRKRFKR